MKIYTKTGDDGNTSLFGGKRVSKSNLRIKAYGTTDELNALIGVILTENVVPFTKDILIQVQNDLFEIGAELASPDSDKNKNGIIPSLSYNKIKFLEECIDKIEIELPELKNFILPGGSNSSALLHFARTICRRAERNIVELSEESKISQNIIIYLNRLSDLLFVTARYENLKASITEIKWKPWG